MGWRRALQRTALVVTAAVLTAACTSSAAAGKSGLTPLTVRGNQLVTTGGRIRLVGVNRSGTEYMCLGRGDGFFDGPHDQSSVTAMKTWNINTVRLPLNESCWLGNHGVPNPAADYRAAIVSFVWLLRRNGLFVILDNHVATDATTAATDILPMPDDDATAMWTSVATTFSGTPGVIFDLYNEPHTISWPCWRDGCTVPVSADEKVAAPYQSPGMQALVSAIRGTGARQPILLGGLDWANNTGHWAAYVPKDPAHHLIVDEHTYGADSGDDLAPCPTSCRADLVALHQRFPVVSSEIGNTDCRHGYVDDYMHWADVHDIGYLAWTWDATAPGSWTCDGGPALIADYSDNPTPTGYGAGVRSHFLGLHTGPMP